MQEKEVRDERIKFKLIENWKWNWIGYKQQPFEFTLARKLNILLFAKNKQNKIIKTDLFLLDVCYKWNTSFLLILPFFTTSSHSPSMSSTVSYPWELARSHKEQDWYKTGFMTAAFGSQMFLVGWVCHTSHFRICCGAFLKAYLGWVNQHKLLKNTKQR